VAKAPGKVLVAGGYGVLEEENVGLSLAVDNYFFAVSERTEGEGEDIVVKVDSPQVGQTWEYRYNPSNRTIQER
jgi:phosphomevalonate kinase